MPLAIWLLVAFCAAATFLHLASAALALRRCRPIGDLPPPQSLPSVSLVRTVCGVDRFDALTLRTGFELDYPNVELIFCCEQATDPAAALVRQLIAEHPHVKARLIIGRDIISMNPKLNNMVKGWHAAQGEWIIFADSNVLMPRDYVQRLLAGWRDGTGVLCSPPIGCAPDGFWAELECAFLNTYQARWQYAADSVGYGFAQGKTMLWRRDDLVRAGGVEALAAEVAEDAAATKVVAGLGLRATLVDAPFRQPLGMRSARQVWDRQTRWARLRRMSFPAFFAPEILTGCLPPLLAAALAADYFDLPMISALAALALLWFGGEAVLAWTAGWHLSALSPLAWLLRDLLLPVLWTQAWLGSDFNWRGTEIRAEPRALSS